jgi:ribulose-phosphate 3-epimerase
VSAAGGASPRLEEIRGGLRVLPSILSADFAALGAALAPLEDAGARILHLDVMDGHFVPNITFGPPLVRSVRQNSRAFLDVHLMITEPLRYLESFARAGAGLCTLHAETGADPDEAAGMARELGIGLGVALRPSTDLDAVLARWAAKVDLVLVMSVEPGFGGQSFRPDALDRLRRVRETCDRLGLAPILEVDGGIDPETAGPVAEAGARWLVAGNAIFRQDDPVAAWRRISGMGNAAVEAGRTP